VRFICFSRRYTRRTRISVLIPDLLRRSIVLEFGFLYLPYPTRYQPELSSLAQRSLAQNTSTVAVRSVVVLPVVQTRDCYAACGGANAN
jgi:hypothetical protein